MKINRLIFIMFHQIKNKNQHEKDVEKVRYLYLFL